MPRRLLLLLLAGLASPGWAAESQSPFNYMYLQGGYLRQTEEVSRLQSAGWGLSGSIDLSDHVFADAGWSTVRTDPFEDDTGTVGRLEFQGYSAGLGAHAALTDDTDVTASVSYVQTRMEGLEGFESDEAERDDGYAAALALRFLVLPRLEFSVGPGYSEVGGDAGWDAGIGLGLQVLPRVWLDAGRWVTEEMGGWTVGLRAALGE